MKQRLYFLLISCFNLLIACQTDTTPVTVELNTDQDTISNEPSSHNEQEKPVTQKETFDLVPEGMYRDLNKKLAASSKKISPKEVVQMYYPAEISKSTSFEKIEVQTKKEGAKTIVTLTHDNQSEHIRIQGHRIVMILEQKDAHWQIVSIQQQYKCWIREESSLWSNDKCS